MEKEKGKEREMEKGKGEHAGRTSHNPEVRCNEFPLRKGRKQQQDSGKPLLMPCSIWCARLEKHDIPVIRRWWCLLLMENFALGGHGRWLAHWAEEAMAVGSCLTDSEPMNGPGEIEYGVGALEGVTPPHNLENGNMMSSIRKGVEWLKENHQLMKSKYLPPRIDCMEEEDALKALARLHTHCDTTLDEDDEIRAPFYFTFKNREDMLLFMSAVRDNKNVRVSSFYNPDI
ncbi:uncharacterized protein LOC127653649 [Xyrauchen texanus]|uniref:uncharacterized protein LOC127653649 n=1 Tax=Xyrauchen texanus TaxID=154827 RepID=UPI002241D56C|nr:uncharacterized protein LOC127653649 [Xyrauchen texanus]